MQNENIDRLENIVEVFKSGDEEYALELFGPLSTGEQMYVALAACRSDLLGTDSIAYALVRIGEGWRNELMKRHRYD